MSAATLRMAIARANSTDVDGAVLVVSDHASLEHVFHGHDTFDVVVVLDPPATTGARDRLAAAPGTARLHLTFGARESRFAAEALRASLDVRATLADTYRHLRDVGPTGGAALGTLLRGDAMHARTPGAIVHGLQTLLGRGLLELDAAGRLQLAAADQLVASSTS